MTTPTPSSTRDNWNIHTAIAQVEQCGFECEAGPLGSNAAWLWLKALAQGPRYRMGDVVPHQLTAEVAGFTLTGAVHLTVVGIRMSSSTDSLLWEYDLSKDPPAPYHYGAGVTAKNVPQATIDRAIASQEKQP